VTSKTTDRFWKLFRNLPLRVQRQAVAAYDLFKQNPGHPSLDFKHISPSNPRIHSARVGKHYRVIGSLIGDTVTWTWIGSHQDYDNMINPQRKANLEP
jgi:hypothetical protein